MVKISVQNAVDVQRNENRGVIMDKDFVSQIIGQMSLPEPEINKYSPLTLAYLGDCVYELMIRTMFVYQGNTSAHKLHNRSSRLAKAKTQSDMIRVLKEELTKDEIAVYKRGRNAYSATRAKNSTVSDYRRATGFEALIGYLYMEKKYDRAVELVKIGLEKLKEAPWQ